ncbi:TolC family protein [Ohtaekwangia sp.]|uniref:TolC family protein n=1 Tax=Ohtaekwangia sp. TaxID=2066019 RepID=UPI002F92D586
MRISITRTKAILIFLALTGFCSSAELKAQDTLRLNISQIEEVFLNKNLSLLAQRYNVDAARAHVIQSKLYNNPNVQFTGNIYNPQENKRFDMSNKTGEYIVDVQQLILLAGKRNKQIKLSETGALLEEDMFFDLLRTLRFSLRSDFYQLYFLQNSFQTYKIQIAQLETLNAAFQELLSKGRISMKDAMRVKSLLYTLKAEQAALQNNMNDINAELQLIIQNNGSYIIPQIDSSQLNFDPGKYTLPNLLDTAYANRSDLRFAQNTLKYNQQNYALQKALAVPDLTAGAEFDKRGNFVENASFFRLAMDLPFFNRNQGNIKAAKISMERASIMLQERNVIIENEVLKAYVKILNTDKTLKSFDPSFKDNLQKLLISITENFQRKNISLLEFTDFYESYKENILLFNQLQNDRMQALEALQFSIGKSIF